MRHFLPDPIDEAEPWRFVRVRDRQLRRDIHALVETERMATARALGERAQKFMRLKVEGVLDAARSWSQL